MVEESGPQATGEIASRQSDEPRCASSACLLYSIFINHGPYTYIIYIYIYVYIFIPLLYIGKTSPFYHTVLILGIKATQSGVMAPLKLITLTCQLAARFASCGSAVG